MGMKAIVVQIIDDHEECDTMEYWELKWGLERFVRIMKGMDSYYLGWIVEDDTPRGYVFDDDSLSSQDEPMYKISDNQYVFSEYAENECGSIDTHG